MSAGSFVTSRYQANNGDIHPIRLQPETLTASLGSTNEAPTGTVTVGLRARSRKNTRAYGLGARGAYVRFTGAVPDDYAPNQTLLVPILTQTVFDDIVAGETTGTYLGSPVIVVGTKAESRR